MEGVSAFLAAFALVGLLEIGDKTMLLMISLATKYPPVPTIAGGILGETAVTAIGVGIGAVIVAFIPILAIKLLSGALFIAVGLWNLAVKEKEESGPDPGARNPFLASLGLAFLAELGDKTMLAVIALSSSLAAPAAVFLGASLGLAVVAIASVALGRVLKRHMKARWLRVISGVLFVAAGVIAIVEALWP